MYRKRVALTYAIAQALLYLCCFQFLFGIFVPGREPVQAAFGLLIYNLLALSIPAFAGLLADAGKFRSAAPVGLLAAAAGTAAVFFPWMGVFLCGIGSGLFFSGAGTDGVCYARGRCGRTGVFLFCSLGGSAAGSALGRMFLPFWPWPLLLLCAAGVFFFAHRDRVPKKINGFSRNVTQRLPYGLSAVFCITAIGLLRYLTAIHPYARRGGGEELFCMLCLGLGALAGSSLCDRLGPGRVCSSALLVCLPLFCLFSANLPLSLLGMFFAGIPLPSLFTTPVACLNRYPAFAFGLSGLGVLWGVLPTFLIPASADFVWTAAGLLLTAAVFCRLVLTNNQKVTGPWPSFRTRSS